MTAPRRCRACGRAFTPERHYFHTCGPCWQRQLGATAVERVMLEYLAVGEMLVDREERGAA